MYKFIKTKDKNNTYDATDIVHRVKNDDVTWPDLVEHFINFLRGCSFLIDSGEYVEDRKLDEYLDTQSKDAIEILIKDADKVGRLNEYLVHPNGLIRAVATKYKQREDKEQE